MLQKSLSEKYRPDSLNDIVGQDKAISILSKMVAAGLMRSCIFYGPPGSGKTTAATIIAKTAGLPFVLLNGTNAAISDIRDAVKNANGNTVLLYLDEIQYFNKKQQQSLLPYVESGEIILIGALADNPYYNCYDALLSRCSIIEFKPVEPKDIERRLSTIAKAEKISINDDALRFISETSAGDMRRAINTMELAMLQQTGTITVEDIQKLQPSVRGSTFDKAGDDHYAVKSGLQKSIRGSDPNAAVFYLARFLEAGDMLSPIRRLLIIANEDVGLANPMAVPFVHACCEMAKEVGLPEAKIPLTNAVIYLAISPKACTAEATYGPAAEDVKAGRGNVVPKHLASAHNPWYKWPHAYPNHWLRQQYLPDDLIGKVYYTPGDNQFEQEMAKYWANIMK